MNRREKILAAVVGGMLGIMVVGYLFTKLGGVFEGRRERIDALREEIAGKQRQINKGVRAGARLVRYEEQSLPPKPEQARTIYQAWLLELGEASGFDKLDVKLQSGIPNRDVYYRLRFTVAAQANIVQISDFLHRFYALNILHRIQQMTIRPVKDSKTNILNFTVEALSLPGATHLTSLPGTDSGRLVLGDAAEYQKRIVGFNIFGLPNRAPSLQRVSGQRTYLNKSLTIPLSASDSDKLDSVRYEFVGSVPSGVRLDADSGKISWTPAEEGEYEMVVRAIDDGFPALSSEEMTIKVTVTQPPPPPPPRDPPPPKPVFDVAEHTVVTSVLEANGVSEVWLLERTTGKKHELKVGDKVNIGSFKGVITDIGLDDVQVEVDGKRVLISVGETLTESFEIPAGI